MQFLSNDIIRATGWTLIHSLWQGLVLALVAGILILFTRKAKPALRYNIFTLLFFLLVGSAILTFFYELRQQVPQHVAATVVPDGQAAAAPTPATPAWPQLTENAQQAAFPERFIAYFNEHAPLLVMLWFIVFMARSLWLFGGLVYIQRIRHYKTSPPGSLLLNKLEELAQRLQLNTKVQLLESALVKVPTALGMLKPVILMPLGMMAQLPADQVEAVLLHELAHIRRRDFLVNLIQHFAETVFFFNPALLWLSARIREEREHCCDDIAIAATESRTGYIQALVSFQEYQLTPRAKYAMAFPGKKKQLLDRVKRILGNPNKTLNVAEKSFLLLCFSLIGMLGIVFSQPDKKQEQKRPATEQVERIGKQNMPQENRTEKESAQAEPAQEPPAAAEGVPDPVPPAEAEKSPNAIYFYDGVDLNGITEGTTLTFSGDREAKPIKVYLFKRNQVVYQAETDGKGAITGFKVNGKEVYRKGEDKHQPAAYAAGLKIMNEVYNLPYKPEYQPYQPYQPKRDSVPVLRKGNSVMSGIITTNVGATQYKITVDDNRATGLQIDGVKVPDDQLPSKYPIINSIFRDMEQDPATEEKSVQFREDSRINTEQQQLQISKSATSATVSLGPSVVLVSPPNAAQPRPAPGSIQQAPRVPPTPTPQFSNDADKIIEDLQKDGLITQKSNLSFRLNQDALIVNDKPQSEEIFRKYRQKYIKSPTDSYLYTRSGNHATTHINTGN